MRLRLNTRSSLVSLGRRRWLQAAVGVALAASPFGGVVLEGLRRSAYAGARSREAVAARLVQLLRSPAMVRQIGRAYLWERTPAPGRDDLVTAIVPPVDEVTALAAEPWQLRQFVRDAVEADFEAVRLECIGGWMLAETEARLCALAVSPPRP